jgi:HEAT repeat protein
VLVLGLALVGWATLFLIKQPVNPIHPALDRLAGMEHSKRWSAPELLMIRDMGEEGVEHLRRVIREKESVRTRVLLCVGGKWTGAPRYIPSYPNLNEMGKRLETACQVIHTLGPAARRAMPELVAAMEKGGIGEANSISMALHAIGVDADMVELLLPVVERGAAESPRMQMIWMLARVKPATERTTKYLTGALKDKSPHIQQAAASAISTLGVSNSEVLERLENLQSDGMLDSLQVQASSALWELTKNREKVLGATFALTERALRSYTGDSWHGSGGQGLDGVEQPILQTGDMWARMKLEGADRERALGLLKNFCEKSGRIFIKMILLPSMMELGLGMDAGQAVCREGMSAPEDYYQIQAARLMAQLSERGAVDEKTVEEMLESDQVGVRVYGAKVHWKLHRKAEAVLPKLIDALDRKKYQSYYYPEIQQTSLTTLKEMGADAAPAKKVLEELRSDPNPDVVKLVDEILR